MTLVSGSTFGRFRILRRLGAGAMGEVHLAEDPQIDRRVAIKTVLLLPEAGLSSEELWERLRREARAAGRLLHPHVVTLFEAGEIDDAFFLVFEYVQGQDLAARMRAAPPLSLGEVLRIARQAAAGLAAAHRRGIVHRDIKPSNLLLSDEGTVKISDFGIAKLTGQTVNLTHSGSLVGTPHYLSPEQVRGEELDGRSDLFSLGVVLYELLSGRLPFEGETLSTLIYQVLSQDPEPLGAVRPDLTPNLASTVMRLLAKDPAQRFATAEALEDALRRIEEELAAHSLEMQPTLLASPAATVVEPRPRPRSRWFLIAGSTLSAAGLSLALLWSPWRKEAPEIQEAPSKVEHAEVPRGVEPVAKPENRSNTLDEAPTPANTALRPSDSPDQGRREAVPATRDVGGAVTFRISPLEAADHAVIKVDGLVRGPAANSLVTLSPGEHRLEIIAPGYAPVSISVEAHSGGGTSDLTVRMEGR